MKISLFSLFYRLSRKIRNLLLGWIVQRVAYIKLVGNGVEFNSTLVCNGLPIVEVGRKALCRIGDHCKINSDIRSNPIGRHSPSILIVRNSGRLIIGNHTGISSSAIICHKEITIGNYVKLGGNVVVYDTDFHSLSHNMRRSTGDDSNDTINKSVVIEDDVFVGAHTTILKGVTIGKGSIVGAASLVTKSIPAGEIWGGNPAKFIKKVGA
jgi:acetyltransferase-like isoleucine patch superfamily enzyme